METTLFNGKTVGDVEFCLQRGDNIDHIINYNTPYMHHCLLGNIQIVSFLVEKGCNVEGNDNDDGLSFCSMAGNYELLTILLQIQRVKAQLQNSNALHDSCLYHNCDVFDILVKNGAQINRISRNWYTPLTESILSSNTYTLRRLLDLGANDEPALLLLPLTIECLDILLCYGYIKYINFQNEKGKTPLHKAVLNVEVEVLNRLIDCGANINLQDNKYRTPLDYAIKHNNENIINLLITHGGLRSS